MTTNIKNINNETLDAMKELLSGDVTRFTSVYDLFEDLGI